eukprot:1259638-Prorocentrum_lima.AAC.1
MPIFVPGGEEPKRPGTCELAPGVDILVGVHICGNGGVVNPEGFMFATIRLVIAPSSLCDGEGGPGYILFPGL